MVRGSRVGKVTWTVTRAARTDSVMSELPGQTRQGRSSLALMGSSAPL